MTGISWKRNFLIRNVGFLFSNPGGWLASHIICLLYFLLVLAIPPLEKIKDSGKPGRLGGLNVPSIKQKSAASPGPVHAIMSSSPQRPQLGDTTKLRNGKGDTEANFRSYTPSKHQSRVAMKGKQTRLIGHQ